MAVLAGGHEQRQGAVIVHFAFVEQTRRVAISEIVLRIWVAFISQTLQNGLRLREQSRTCDTGLLVFLFVKGCGAVVHGSVHFLNGIDHEHGELILHCRIVGLFDICEIHFECLFVAKQRRIVSDKHAQVIVLGLARRG